MLYATEIVLAQADIENLVMMFVSMIFIDLLNKKVLNRLQSLLIVLDVELLYSLHQNILKK
jgi:hypothetical protein